MSDNDDVDEKFYFSVKQTESVERHTVNIEFLYWTQIFIAFVLELL